MVAPMSFKTLIETEELVDRLHDPRVAIVDCRFTLDNESWGESEYRERHIPGARYAHLDGDLSGRKTGLNGRHPLPDPTALASTFGRLGIDNGIQVVAYDQDNGMYASRLWWLLKWLGHDAVAVLNGGFAKWIREQRETDAQVVEGSSRRFIGSPRSGMTANADQVAELLGRRDWLLLDARAPERYRGDVEPIDKVAGHIPGAANLPFKSNLSEAGTFRSRDELRGQLISSLEGLSADHIVCYCGSGVTACHDILALEHAGMPGARLYPGSWSEWSADGSRPIETGVGA